VQAVVNNFTHAFSQMISNGCRPSSSSSEALATEPHNPRTCKWTAAQTVSWADHKVKAAASHDPKLGRHKGPWVRQRYAPATPDSPPFLHAAKPRVLRHVTHPMLNGYWQRWRREANDILLVLFIHMPKYQNSPALGMLSKPYCTVPPVRASQSPKLHTCLR
jgi:hypothetical protein